MSNSVIITTISSDRWTEYRDLRLDALKTEPLAFASSYEENVSKPDSHWQEHFNSSKSYYLFAQDQNQLIGMVLFYWDERPRRRHIANIAGTYVKPAYRGQGLGKLLMKKIIDAIKQNPQFTKIKISVNTVQSAASALYAKCGFRIVGKYYNELYINGKYYEELLMEMQISNPSSNPNLTIH